MGSEMCIRDRPLILDGEKYFVGHTREYIRAAVKTEDNLSNRFVNIKAKEILKDLIILGE